MVDAELSAEDQAKRIAQAAKPALVLTTSHATTRKLAALLPSDPDGTDPDGTPL
jgi:hypothetical protein